MRIRVLPVLAIISLAIMLPAHRADADPAPPQLRDEIVSLSQQLMDAIGEGRKDVWQRIAADDAVIVDEFGRRQGKKDIVDSLRPFPPGFSGSIEIRDPRVNVYGDTAVIECEEYERETVFGQKLVVRYIAINTFVRRNGEWKLVAMEDVTLPTPPPKLLVSGLQLSDYAGVYRYGPDRAWTFSVQGDRLSYTTKPGRPAIIAEPVAKDVFMEDNDERNLLVFRRDASGRVVALIERRKFNDLKLDRSH
ncbi:MAG TPA: nuclear transport factor 2 family protein [Rhodanobacteraceae bacterium]|nr:nuclear transport factor 2 family protein [Rhodanobacteraceae bacterium]